MEYRRCFGGGSPLKAKFRCGATSITAGCAVMRDTNLYGDVIPIAVNSATDAYGAATETPDPVYDATPTVAELNAVNGSDVEVIYDPLAIYGANISGSATAATALSGVSICYGAQTAASATVFTFSATFTTDFNGGSICCTDGANKGLVRKITSDIDSTSRTVTVAFPNTIAVGDHALMVPYASGLLFGYFTTNFVELDGYTADGSGAAARIVDVVFDVPNLSAEGRFMFSDHVFNPESS